MKLHLPAFLRKSLLSCLSAVIVCTVGSGVAWANAQNLTCYDSYVYWDTLFPEFVDEYGSTTAFAQGDNVSFIGESYVELGQDITAGTVAIEQGADVTIESEPFELKFDRIELSGTLDVGDSLSVGEGSTLTVQSASAVLDSNLVLGENGVLSVTGAGGSLNGHSLVLQEGASLILTGAVLSRETTDIDQDGELSLIVTPTGDGKTYTLLTGVSEVVDKEGNALRTGDYYSINELFDTTLPGTGFWADGDLVLTNDGTLQLVRYDWREVEEAITITTHQVNPAVYQYYAGVCFENIEYTTGSSSAYGGAIYGDYYSTITLSDNGSVTFSGNTASSSDSYSSAYGGAIYGDYYSTITLSDNGSVTFSGNTASSSDSYSDAEGGAIYGGDITLSDNGSVVFEGNTASSSYSASGGAINGDTITLSDNGSVTFSGNTASGSGSACGGAVSGNVTLSNNGSVTFSGNTASGSYGGYGGAIYGGDYSTITLSDNVSVEFCGNEADSPHDSSYGGAIHVGSDSTILLSNNGSLLFSANRAVGTEYEVNVEAYGGAIFGDTASSITLSNNGCVMFSDNKARATSNSTNGIADAEGGAISGPVSMTRNGDITFCQNSVYAYIPFSANTNYGSYYASAGGGAIAGDVTMMHNGDIEFRDNWAGYYYYHSTMYVNRAYGGAIAGDVTMAYNGDITFIGNYASSSDHESNAGSVYGGAIYGDVVMTYNGDITFCQNSARGDYYTRDYVYGGAINGAGDILLSSNGSVTFNGNKVSGDYAYGGAIYTSGNLSIRNNDSVEFYQNAEVKDGVYRLRLRSIYVDGNGDVVSLSAAAGKSIVFRDSVYIGSGNTVNLNEDYTYQDAEGVFITVKQQGDIIFTGATTVDDLYAVNGNVSGTEILNSRTSEVMSMTHLYGGCLRVEEGAVYKGCGITVAEGSAATVRVQNAELSHSGYDLTFNAGTTLELAGASSITGNVQMLGGSTLLLNKQEGLTETQVLGNLNLAGSATLALSNDESWRCENGVLMYVIGSVSGWNSATLTVTGAGTYGVSDLSWVDNMLILNYNADSFNQYFNGRISYSSTLAQALALLHHYEDIAFADISAEIEGGAIYGNQDSNIMLINNGSVSFRGNTATAATDAHTYGGAIYGAGDIMLSTNGSVEFCGNTAYADAYTFADYSGGDYACAHGGAIYGDGGSTIILTDNGSVSFSGNTAFSVESYAYGGAIYGGDNSTIMLSGNGSAIFSGNTASAVCGANGGAIYTTGNLSIQNNDSVEFYQNAEVTDGVYRLRSIYAGGSGDVISLSAAAGKSITFRDSIYIDSDSTFKLNEDYTYLDEDGVPVTVEQKGDIVFTGADTEQHLNDLLETAGAGRTATDQEILNSRTTEVNAMTNLYGGRLRVEEGAIYQGQGITAHAGSASTVLVKDATLSHSGYDLTFNAGTTLELVGNNTISGNLQMLEGSTLRFIYAADTTLDLTGSLNLHDSVTMQLSGYGKGSHKLLTMDEATLSGWEAVSFINESGNALDRSRFSWENNVLYFISSVENLVWTNASGDGLWNNESQNWSVDGTPYAISVLQNVTFATGGNETITMVGNQLVESLTVQQGGQFVLNGNAPGTTLTVRGDVLLEENSALTLHGNLEAAAVNGEGALAVTGALNVDGGVTAASLQAESLSVDSLTLTDAAATNTIGSSFSLSGAATVAGALVVEGELEVHGQLTAASLNASGLTAGALTLTDAAATNTIGGNVTLSGAATVAGTLVVDGSFASGTLQVKSLTAGGSITTGKLTGDSATLVALNGNVELTDEHESLNGNSNEITATGGDVLVKDNVKGDGNIFTATAVRDASGNITSGGNYLSHVQDGDTWSALEGSNNQILADAAIRLDEIAGSSNTLTAGTSISATKITGSNNRLTAGTELILNGAINGNGNVLDAGQRLITNKNAINGDSNRLTTDTWLRTGTINGQENVLTAGTSIDIDGNIGSASAQASDNILTAGAHININGGNGTITGSRNELRAEAYIKTGAITGDSNELSAGSYINARDITGNSNSLIAGNGNLVAGAVYGTGNTLSAVNGSITAASIAGAGNVVTARSLTVTGGVEGASLTLTNGDASNSIGGNVTLSGAATVAGRLEVEGDVSVSGQVTAASLTAASLQAGSLTAGSLTLTDATATNTVSGNAALSGAVNVAGALQVGGDLTLESGASVANPTISVGGAVTMSGSALTSTVISGATGNISISNSRLTTSGVETTSGNATITGTLATTPTAKEYANESEKSGGIKSFTTSLAKVGAGSSVITSVKVKERDSNGTQDTTTPLRMVIKDAAGNVIATSTNTVTLSNTKVYREFEFAPTLLDPAASYTFAFVDATTGAVQSVSLQLEDQRNNGNVALGDVTALTDKYATAKLGALVQFGYLGSENQLLGATVTTGNGALNLSGTYVAAANGEDTVIKATGYSRIDYSVLAGGTNVQVANDSLRIEGSYLLGDVNLKASKEFDFKGDTVINIDGGEAHDASLRAGTNLWVDMADAVANDTISIRNADVQVGNRIEMYGGSTMNLTNVYAMGEDGSISASDLGLVKTRNSNELRGTLNITGSIISAEAIWSNSVDNLDYAAEAGTAINRYFGNINVADSEVEVSGKALIENLSITTGSEVSILGGAYLDTTSIDGTSKLTTGGASKLDDVNIADGGTLRVTETGNGVTTLANLNPGSTGTVTVDVVNGTLQTPVVNERVALGLNGGTLLIKAVEAHGTALGASVAAVNPHVVLASVSNAGAAEVTQISTIRMEGLTRFGSDETKNDGIASLTVKGAFDADKITINAYKLATDEGNTSGFIQIDGALTGADNVLNADAHILVKGVLTGSGNQLTAYNGNVTLNATYQSLNGSNNTISATGGNVNLTDDAIGSNNVITATAVTNAAGQMTGGSILSANKWASIVGDTNTLTADDDILLESIGSESVAGNNNVLNAGDSITINGTGNGTGINGSGNTLTAGTSIASRNIKGDRNQLTADEITATIVDGTGNALTGTTVDITGELKGSANTVEGNEIHVGTVSGTGQEIISNGVDNAADIAIDIDTLSGMNAVIGVLNDGSLNIDSMTAQTGSGDTGSYITVLKGNVGIGTLNTTAENTISVGASYGITVGSGSASNQTWTAGSLAATGADGLTLTDSTVTISGAVESTAELNLAGDTALTATSVQAGTLRLDGADVMLSADRVVADEVVVDTPANNTAVFNELVADKVTVTSASSLPDNLSVGGGSVIGELVADKLEVREGTATLGSTAKQTEQELQSIALQKDADLVLQGQTSLSVTDSVAMTAGSEVQIQSGATLQNGAVALSAAPGSSAAQLSSKTATNLVEMQRNTQFSIHDMLLVNTSISAAEGNTVTISGVEGSENLHLLGGADFSLTFADNKADVGMAVIENSSPVTGITLSAGSTLTLVMDPTNNDFRDYNLVINMSGFEYEGGSLAATGGITDLNAAGIYLGGWLGELLADQGVVQEGVGNLESPEVPGDSIPTVSYTYSTENNVGMIISIHGLSVPEPTTTTLSLLALTALAARRRRND